MKRELAVNKKSPGLLHNEARAFNVMYDLLLHFFKISVNDIVILFTGSRLLC